MKKIIKIMLKKQLVRVSELVDKLSLSRPAVQKALSKLIEQNVVKKVGKGKDTSYQLNEETSA